MRRASRIVFRRITAADFFNIYKEPGTESRGGGQSYIDIDTSGVSIADWAAFLTPTQPELKAQDHPAWTVTIRSIGLDKSQQVGIAQRRATTVSIRRQKIVSSEANRVFAWDPRFTEFPQPARPLQSAEDPQIPPLIDGLVIYLVRDGRGEIWAGWFKARSPEAEWIVPQPLMPMFTAKDGHIHLRPAIEFDETDFEWPFGLRSFTSQQLPPATEPKVIAAMRRPNRVLSEDDILDQLFDADEAARTPTLIRRRIAKVRVRNTAAVKLLKLLYRHQCQITGDKFIFDTKDGPPYTEAHHLVPLGRGGWDSPLNLIVVSAHVHKLLHYAAVPEVSITDIENRKLDIKINSKSYRIEWHPKHARMIERRWKRAN